MSAVVDAQPWHLLSVAARLPERDLNELKLLGYRDEQEVAVRRAVEVGVRFTIIDKAGVPQVCFGITESQVPGVGTLWMLRAVGAEPFVKTGRKTIAEIVRSGLYRRIETFASTDCEACRKLITWLGFAYEGTRKAFFTDGSDVDQFAIVKGV